MKNRQIKITQKGHLITLSAYSVVLFQYKPLCGFKLLNNTCLTPNLKQELDRRINEIAEG